MKKTGKLLPFFLVTVLMVAALTVVAAAQTAALPEQCPVLPFSAEKGTGRDELIRMILDVTE